MGWGGEGVVGGVWGVVRGEEEGGGGGGFLFRMG